MGKNLSRILFSQFGEAKPYLGNRCWQILVTFSKRTAGSDHFSLDFNAIHKLLLKVRIKTIEYCINIQVRCLYTRVTFCRQMYPVYSGVMFPPLIKFEKMKRERT